MSDAAWEALQAKVRRTSYERRLLRGVPLREAEAKRRREQVPPPTLNEAIGRHLRESTRVPFDCAALPHLDWDRTWYIAPGYRPPVDEVRVAEQLAEALAQPSRERLAKFGWLIHLPFGVTVPEHMQHDSYRWEIPAWALEGKSDDIRDEFFCDIVDGRMDEKRLSKILAGRKYTGKAETKAKRALHSDEVGLDALQKAHLRKLRGRLNRAQNILQVNLRANVPADRLTVSQGYVDSAVAAIKAARVSYGLPGAEPEVTVESA